MKQKTIKKKISYTGIGLHKGQKCTLTFNPAPVNFGIVFHRSDLPFKNRLPALAKYVLNTKLGTNLKKDEFFIYTVEHVLAAITGAGITNLLIELDNIEPPVGDGSSLTYLKTIFQAGIQEQTEDINYLEIKEPIFIKEQEKFIIALPEEYFKISYTLKYDNPLIGTEYYEENIGLNFKQQISPARTFGFLKDYEYLKKNNLALGCTLDNVIVIGEDKILTPLRFNDEFVRHKILDIVGDFTLLGKPLKGHIIANKTGHNLNIKLIKKIIQKYNLLY